MSVKNISISARLILVMSLTAILTAALSAYLIVRFIDSGKQVEVLAEEGTHGIIWGEKANFYLHNLIINFYRANSGDMKWVIAMEDNIPKIRFALKEYAQTAQDPENKQLLAETEEALDVYARDIYILGQSFREGIYGPDIIQVLNDLETKSHANRLISAINNLVEYSKDMAEKNRANFFADMSKNTTASIILACFVMTILIGAGYMGVIWTRNEIAEYNAKEDILKKARYDAEEASRAKSDFLARMSHEIRTPMNAIIGMSHLIMRTTLSDAQMDYQTKILSASQQLMTIINDILDFSKIEAGKMGLEHISFHLDDVFNSLADVILIDVQEKVEIIFSISADTPQYLTGDSLRLTQVLINLTNNAVKFTPSGEICVSVECAESCEQHVLLHFSVTDTGIGMTAEQTQKLFQPFSQADGSITRKFGGTGLGLAICKKLVEAMGGRIWVESQKNQGSSFHFTIQLDLNPNQQKKRPLPQKLRNLNMLVIDDNDTSSKSITTMLHAVFSVTPEQVSCADDALELIELHHQKNTPYDLIFVDWDMPNKDGMKTTHLIRKRIEKCTNNPFIVLMINNYELEIIRSQAKRTGVDAFLIKPTCPSNIFDTAAALYGHKSNSHRNLCAEVKQEQLKKVHGTLILLVEDNRFNQQIAKELLEQAGMIVEIASNGFTALELVEKNAYDLILMDIQMPDLDGLEVTRRIRTIQALQEIPIVAMTAHAMSDDRKKSLDAGMNDHITKPIHPEALMDILIKWGRKSST